MHVEMLLLFMAVAVGVVRPLRVSLPDNNKCRRRKLEFENVLSAGFLLLIWLLAACHDASSSDRTCIVLLGHDMGMRLLYLFCIVSIAFDTDT